VPIADIAGLVIDPSKKTIIAALPPKSPTSGKDIGPAIGRPPAVAN
jgi:hypothetical protein